MSMIPWRPPGLRLSRLVLAPEGGSFPPSFGIPRGNKFSSLAAAPCRERHSMISGPSGLPLRAGSRLAAAAPGRHLALDHPLSGIRSVHKYCYTVAVPGLRLVSCGATGQARTFGSALNRAARALGSAGGIRSLGTGSITGCCSSAAAWGCHVGHKTTYGVTILRLMVGRPYARATGFPLPAVVTAPSGTPRVRR